MKLLKEITDLEILGEEHAKSSAPYTTRAAARAIIFDDANNIAILSVPKHNLHKLPGGGLEDGEDIQQALQREILEEVGSQIEITDELGMIIEYKDQYSQKQTSYGYLARLKGLKGEPSFTKEEKDAGFELLWLPIDEAVTLLENDHPTDYTAKFIRLRDLTFLREAKKILVR